MSCATGERNIAMKKNSAVNIEERPVRPPSATPAEDSTKVVTVEVPQTAPVVVAIASASIALSMFGTSPSLVSILPRAQAPYRVPMVSNISTMQNARAVVMIVRTRLAVPCSAAKREKSKPSVKTLRNASEPKALKASSGLDIEIASG